MTKDRETNREDTNPNPSKTRGEISVGENVSTDLVGERYARALCSNYVLYQGYYGVVITHYVRPSGDKYQQRKKIK